MHAPRCAGKVMPMPVREIASVEIRAVVAELSPKLSGAFVRKFYDLGDGAFRFAFHSKDADTIVYCRLASTFNETSLSESAGEATQFAMGMRKRIEGAKVASIAQRGSDRIIELRLSSKEGERTVVIEMFGKGNMILVDAKGVIELCYLTQSFRGREIRPRAVYRPPPTQAAEIWGATGEQMLSTVREALGAARAMPALSKLVNIGPLYLEDAFNSAGLDPMGRIDEAGVAALAGSISRLLADARSPRPRIYRSGAEVVDYAILPIRKYDGAGVEAEACGSVSEMLDRLHSGERSEVRDEAGERRRAELSASIAIQEELVAKTMREAAEYQGAGEAILQHMHEINSLVGYMAEHRRATVGELSSAFPGLAIRLLDLKEKRVVVEMGGDGS